MTPFNQSKWGAELKHGTRVVMARHRVFPQLPKPAFVPEWKKRSLLRDTSTLVAQGGAL
jgi:hypothetical protein